MTNKPATPLADQVAKIAALTRQALTRLGHCYETKSGDVVEVSFSSLATLQTRRYGPVGLLEVDTQRLPRKVSIDALTTGKVLHHLTAVTGHRVIVLNTTGLTYCVLLQPQSRRRLPALAELDLSGRPPGEYQIGLGLGKEGPVWLDLEKACHLMVGGSSDSGKSAFLRSLLYQLMVLPAPVEVVLVDMEGRTFSAFEGLPRVVQPVAGDVDSATAISAWLLGQMDWRGRLFDATGQHPEKLAEYHQVPGVERLPWIVAVFDEFTALLDAAGRRSELYRHIGQLAMRSRKYGITLVFAGQDFKSELVNSRITNQVRTRIAHRCATRHQSQSILGREGAQYLQAQGRALISLHGRVQEVQGWWVPRSWVLELHEDATGPTLLTPEEARAFAWAAEGEGDLSGADIQALLDLSEWQARRQAEAWERLGLLEKNPHNSNKRRLTAAARELLKVGRVGL